MVYDSIANASIPTATSNPKDFSKKKRVNRSAKLKQCKLDARREQWLSQGKNKGVKDGGGDGKIPVQEMHAGNERDRSVAKLEINPGVEERQGLINHYSDSESPSNSPTSHTSSVLGTNRSGTNFTGSSRGSTSSSGSSGGCCSGSITEEDEGDDGCLDDWEAVADALAADDESKREHQHKPITMGANGVPMAVAVAEQEPLGGSRAAKEVCIAPVNCRAWRPDDAFRPQSLPNLLKQNSFPMNSEKHYVRGGAAWACKNVVSAPTSCPICCEDLDLTDSSFLPCLCGFRLCLFCHKRILEDDGRCPGCRKPYDMPVEGAASSDVRLARSYSMVTRF